MNKILTSFINIPTAEGERITYSYSEINEDGIIVKQNEKDTFIVFDAKVLKAISTIKDYIDTRLNPNE